MMSVSVRAVSEDEFCLLQVDMKRKRKGATANSNVSQPPYAAHSNSLRLSLVGNASLKPEHVTMKFTQKEDPKWINVYNKEDVATKKTSQSVEETPKDKAMSKRQREEEEARAQADA